MLNFLRLGSEAVAIALYAAAVHAVISVSVTDGALADQIAAGAAGYGETYAVAFRAVLWAVIALTAVVSVGIAICHHLSRRMSRA